MSLSESCLAVAIISTIAMIAVPSLVEVRETYLVNAAARHVAGQMHAARILATITWSNGRGFRKSVIVNNAGRIRVQ
jgi:Tfp pilus assembly protein FimT